MKPTTQSQLPETIQMGYSLVEVLVAISILLIVVTGPLTILTTTARSTNFASEQVAAFFLAQEGLELIQKIRDDLFLEHFNGTRADPWNDFKDAITACISGPCRVQLADSGEVTVGAATTPVVRTLQYAGSGRARIRHDATASVMAPTYSRRITVTDGGDGVLVRSEVTWVSGSVAATQRLQVDTYLYNSYNISP